MRAVVQRVLEAEVVINNKIYSNIEKGLLIFVGIEESDNDEDVKWLTKKISMMRIFSDNDGLMNLSLKDLNFNVLIISQFTLHSMTKKGNRPSFIKAAKPEIAIPIYNNFCNSFKVEIGEGRVFTGVFGADMKIKLTNDGPVTIIIDSKKKE